MTATHYPRSTLRYRDATQVTSENPPKCDVSTIQRTDTENFSNTKEGKVGGLKRVSSSKLINCEDIKENDSSIKCHTTWELCDFHSLPDWLKNNEYLFKSHRPPLYSYSACFWSIFRMHSETGNIWSHLIACIIFTVLGIQVVTDPTIAIRDSLLTAPYFIGAICCLAFSTIYHTLHCCSQPDDIKFSRLDYCGIVLLIMGSMITLIYYSFYCHIRSRNTYISAVMVLGSVTITISFSENFGTPEYRVFRALIFSSLGLSGVVPALHFYMLVGFNKLISEDKFLMVQAIFYILGAILYAKRFPECYFVGKCDIWFQSHQLFHILVVFATLSNYLGIQKILQNMDSVKNCHYHYSNIN